MRWAIVAFIGLAACVPEDEDPVKKMPSETSCGAQELQHLVGGPVDAFDFEALNKPLRVLPAGSVMTMDHRPDRLNVTLDEGRQIIRIWCG